MRILALVVSLMISASAATQNTEPAESWLLLEQAASATITDGRLTLTGVDDTIIAFSDRPNRDVASESLSGLVDNWSRGENSFAQTPPNAALTGLQKGQQIGLIVELSDPILEDGVLSFTVEVLNGKGNYVLSNPSLVIDNLCRTKSGNQSFWGSMFGCN
ncbi:MAG: hypothetical protein AAGI44_15375 [Pseudomonadota bacterium]